MLGSPMRFKEIKEKDEQNNCQPGDVDYHNPIFFLRSTRDSLKLKFVQVPSKYFSL